MPVDCTGAGDACTAAVLASWTLLGVDGRWEASSGLRLWNSDGGNSSTLAEGADINDPGWVKIWKLLPPSVALPEL